MLMSFFETCRGIAVAPPAAKNLPQYTTELPRHTTEPSTDLHGIPWNPNPNPNPDNLTLVTVGIGVSWGLP